MAESQITRAVLLSVRQMEIELNVVATESGSQAEKITYCFSESVITGRETEPDQRSGSARVKC